MVKNKPTVVSLFSGCGGLDLGFKKAGFDIIWANDFDKDSTITYKRNIGDHITLGDIREINSSQIPKNADVLLGGFPCQGFSVANTKRSMKDERNFLYKEMLRVINDTKPKFFVAENVKGLLSMENGKVAEMIVNDFRAIGYNVSHPKVLTAADYGVPQLRQRVVIIGNRIGKNNSYPSPTHEGRHITTKEAIGHLPEPETKDGKKIPNHKGFTNVNKTFLKRKFTVSQPEICDYLKIWRKKSKLSTKKIDQLLGYKHTAGHWFRKDSSGSLPKLEDWLKLKKILGFDDKYDQIMTEFMEEEITFEQTLRVTNWERPSDTITATGPEIHVNKKRRLTPRECAILQSFPNDFIFEGSISSQYRQIGNAVPPKLGYEIAKKIKSEL